MEFKSWREEYGAEDVRTFLQTHSLDNDWGYYCIAGDGDLLLMYQRDLYIHPINVKDLVKIETLFGATSLVFELDDGKLYLTLSWNN